MHLDHTKQTKHTLVNFWANFLAYEFYAFGVRATSTTVNLIDSIAYMGNWGMCAYKSYINFVRAVHICVFEDLPEMLELLWLQRLEPLCILLLALRRQVAKKVAISVGFGNLNRRRFKVRLTEGKKSDA